METQQLLDALTDHMAVYHCRKRQLERQQSSSSGKSDRHRVVEWLARLSVKERQIACTIVDEAWVALLLQMQKALESEGPGFFFVLPDFPSAAKDRQQNANLSKSSPPLPGLCFRKARGLLKRQSSNGELLATSLRLYSSRVGEACKDLAETRRLSSLDSVTVSYELLENVERLVGVMDEISYGEFLATQCLSGGSPWEETPWLKRVGYYSLSAFVANKLEISLWSAWITALGTKQPSKSLSRSLARCAFETTTTSSKVCTRRQGFEQWWSTLHANDRRKACDFALAKLSTDEALMVQEQRSLRLPDGGTVCDKQFGRLCSGIQFLNDLRWTLSERVVYSSLHEAHSHSESALQVLRNTLMKVMKDYMEYDLLDHGNKGVPRENSVAKKIQVKARKSKSKKQKKNVTATHRSDPVEDESAQPDNMDRIGESAKDMAALHVSEQCQDTGWVPGKRKKRNKKVKHDAAETSGKQTCIPSGAKNTEKAQGVENFLSKASSEEESSTTAATEGVTTVDMAKQEVEPTTERSSQHQSVPFHLKNNQAYHPPPPVMSSSHEWPGAPQSRFSDSCGRPLATEWLHLDVNRDWHRSKPPLIAYTPRQNGQVDSRVQRSLLSKAANVSWDWPPMVQPGFGIASPFGFTTQVKDEPPGFVSVPLATIVTTGDGGDGDQTAADDTDREDLHGGGDSDDYLCRTSESEGDPRQLYDTDYNQFFGGGVMYWTSADYTGMGYSRPGSLSSEDSSWARREADLTIVVDDIVGLPPIAASYSGLSSGPSTVACTSSSSGSLDHFAEAQSSAEFPEHIPPPALPPIAVREPKNSKLDSSKCHEARSPHEPRGRRDFVRCKRSPSPVLRCVPPAPPPPPPSPIAGVRKRRGFPTVRSGSSSPRHWGVFNWPDNQLKSLTPEGILPANGWRRCFPTAAMHPLLRERLVAIPPRALEQEHPDVAFPMQTTLLHKQYPAMPTVLARLHKEIEAFSLQVAAENAKRKPFITIAVKKVTHALQVLWPRSRTKVFGSNATGLALPNSDVDLVVCLPPVRNLEPIKEAGILEGRNGIKETCLQHAARYLADQDWVKSDSLKTIENTTIPIIMLVAKCFPDSVLPIQYASDGEATGQHWGTKEDRHLVRLDISFESASHSGLLTAELVKELVSQFPAISPLALVLKQFLMDRGLDHPYTGGLSSYCLVLLITRFLQHQNHLGRPSQTQSLGSLLMDFLHFYGCVFDPRRMCISIRGGGMYVNRDRLHGIDPLHIEDPLHSMNNVGRNCFRILQCTKAFADAYVTMEKELVSSTSNSSLLSRILLSIV
ncbi:uncharacterized protein LOC112344551 isoform X1 [Selaginella moellendorffii]|uniref:uncharacterized protein LOC112344551 isoform X1 n=1 Tax=Selaginella moellendorffii TaxID=88036 RepID=UPI000D1CC228|nr:uncharacterized protein LOC112344551 isoform X1 [Selaginella moellendorffii]XP_024525206.1 uncharacterized protein LOC112344551 isoform X1 [Selaginella moellendorffii]|eukprot:XP_024525198.1 uncharacterized protein LOC112344551 isoform X1 [Selaginella moellendorffii]